MYKLYVIFLVVVGTTACTFILTTDKLEKYTPPAQSEWKMNTHHRVPHWYKGVADHE